MSLPRSLATSDLKWLEHPAPANNIVVSSRTRLARNLSEQPFAPHAKASDLSEIDEQIREAFEQNPYFNAFVRVELSESTATERAFLKEARLISKEMERGGANRAVYVNNDLKCSIMVNEEDHLRLQRLEPGLQISQAQSLLNEVDREAAKVLPMAYHEHFGFLTACPTNVGTGLRASVMMHLPGLAFRREIEGAFRDLPGKGLTVRGFQGENSEGLGDFYQISNEVTLGKSVGEIEQQLADTVATIMGREIEARTLLLKHGGITVTDAIWRSFGILANARKMESAEAMKLLSRLRLGIDDGFFQNLSHEKFNRLVVEIQPGHLHYRHGAAEDAEERDIARANLIRHALTTKS
ncbi:ATP--guanido phosphotransferase [Candidatus Sumerlaeota bacterium]|nr:ATP--guanido phosphotransferase [Candidatus Sumerlaeota bacterium]